MYRSGALSVRRGQTEEGHREFEGFLNKAHPKYHETLPLALGEPEPETGL